MNSFHILLSFLVVFKDMSMKYLSTSFYGFFYVVEFCKFTLYISNTSLLPATLCANTIYFSCGRCIFIFTYFFFFTYFLCHTKSFCLFFYVVSFVYLALLSLPSSKITEDSRVHMLESFSCIFLTVFYPG